MFVNTTLAAFEKATHKGKTKTLETPLCPNMDPVVVKHPAPPANM